MHGLKKNVFNWFGQVERICDESMAKKIYDGRKSGKRGRVRPRLTFENTVSEILEEGHVKSMRTPRRACEIDDSGRGERVCRDRSVWRSFLSDDPARDKA